VAILQIEKDDIEIFTTLINPMRSYSSSSAGITGSVNLFPRASKIEKELNPLSNFSNSLINDHDFSRDVISLQYTAKTSIATNKSFFLNLEDYLNKVNTQSQSEKKKKKIDIIRFTPGTFFTSNTIRKLNIKDMLMPYYRTSCPTYQWGYTNYHSLNFFTSPSVPTSSVLLYPNIDVPDISFPVGHVSGCYSLSGAFSFDFYVNPRYKKDYLDENQFRAGTIFHLSSSYALSVVTGSNKDENGLPTNFRLLLQLSHSSDIPPSLATPGTYPKDLVFLSEDNCLDWNKWHHVVVRWGTNLINDGTGSFIINGSERGKFCVPSGTISPKKFTHSDDPTILHIGNFYEGKNVGTETEAYFFSNIVSKREGLKNMLDSNDRDQPSRYNFRHPLKAEVHDLAIHRYYKTDSEVSKTINLGLSYVDPQKTAFYLPPFFVEKTAVRSFTDAPLLGGNPWGGILQTPFFEIDGSTDDPFNAAMSFGVDGHYINLENFTKEFSNNNFPKLHHLSGTAIATSTEALPANEFLYNDPFVRKRNLTVLPCDDGNFYPNYGILSEENQKKSIDDLGARDLSFISLDNLLNTSSLLLGMTYDAEQHSTFFDQLIGFSPENPQAQSGDAISNAIKKIKQEILAAGDSYDPGVQREIPLTIFQRTKDPSSNQITIFDISNLYYGSRILPGSFSITDNNMSGSGGQVSMTLVDDGFGSIYRASSLSKNCDWNSVGNIFYNEGIVVIKSPHLFFFGKNQYEIIFKGEHKLHSLKYDIIAPPALLNSSSNPTYAPIKDSLKASGDPLDNSIFVYISDINFHDNNMNVIAKARLAQPVIKREAEKILFKIAFDF
jgi:hypothetical protein